MTDYYDKFGSMILTDGKYYSLDDKKTHLNNNLMIVGCSGAGKTRGIITPNLLECNGSYVVTDPKGNLHKKWGKYLKAHGYRVVRLSFIHPETSAHWNPLKYVHTTQEIQSLSHSLVAIGGSSIRGDAFWDQTATMLFNSIIGFVIETQKISDRNIHTILKLLRMSYRKGYETDDRTTPLGKMMAALKLSNPESWAAQQYEELALASGKTWASIGITAVGKISALDTEELQKMLKSDNVNIKSIGQRKTAVFVEISDSDRTMDDLANIFYSQVIHQLCTYADEECKNSELPVPTRLILDDFSTNCRIDGFENMISNIRSRKISATIVLQSLSQLETGYGRSAAQTISENFDTMIYLGGNDPHTAEQIAVRVNKPVDKILHMPLDSSWIIRRGSDPVFCQRNMELDDYLRNTGIEHDIESEEGDDVCRK